MGVFSRLREAGRKRLAERHPIPDELWDWAFRGHKIFRGMPDADIEPLRRLTTLFLATKRFDPVGGAEVDDELKVSVATQACLPLVGLDIDWYRDFSTIIITPDYYNVTKREADEAGVIHEYEDEFAGESFDLGPVALSIPDIDASGWGDGYNVVIHEMAHKIDGRNGVYDGCPPLHMDMDAEEWKKAFSEAFADFKSKLEAPHPGKGAGGRRKTAGKAKSRTRIDPYAAESPDEFFAVACEYFYERPGVLWREYPAVYAQLKAFFRRDPVEWGS